MAENISPALSNQPDEDKDIWQVSDLAAALKTLVEDNFSQLRLRAEIGRVSRPASGHIYLDLKDDKAVLNGVIWRQQTAGLAVAPEEGLEVICRGRLTTFPGQSRYQIIIESMAAAGEGALMALLAARRKKLHGEGLFDEARKKPLPFAPETIGVITSASGAVIQDILHRLSERWPCRVILWPVRVQGEAAAAEVKQALEGFNRHQALGLPRPDIIIIARGGGSLEDLMPFNDEDLVRAAAASEIPLISAIGHETDHSLLDEAADKRAPTPSAAAELASPVLAQMRRDFIQRGEQIGNALASRIHHARRNLTLLGRALGRGVDNAGFAAQRFDALAVRLAGSWRAASLLMRGRLGEAAAKLTPLHLAHGLARMEAQIKRDTEKASQLMRHRYHQTAARAQALFALLGSLNYQTILRRGFALVRSAKGDLLRDTKAAQQAKKITIEFADGKVAADIGKTSKPKLTDKQPDKSSQGQGRLL